MEAARLTFRLPDEEQTVLFGCDLAAALRPGDFVALSGEVGAGKSAIARAIIRSLRADLTLEVPSPTFSLMQLYEGSPPIAHLDLYRIGSAVELDELGIDEALQDGIVIAEWADRFARHLPVASFSVRLEEDAGGGRLAHVGTAGASGERLARSLEIRDFLAKAGWKEGWRRPLAGDASARTYELVSIGDGDPLLIMDAPARPDGPPTRHGKPYSRIVHLAETVTPFVAIAAALRQAGFCAPELHSADLSGGILLMEYLGKGRFLDAGGQPVAERYLAAADLLAGLRKQVWPHELSGPFGARHHLPEYDRWAMLAETELLTDWYLPFVTGREASEQERNDHAEAWNDVLDRLSDDWTMVLRDYHSPNIIWRAEKSGLERLGLIDFQDALMGPAAYDLASLAQDARVTIPENLEQAAIDAYCRARRNGQPFDEEALRRDYAIMSLQRNAKILGIFVRLDRRDGKPAYLAHLPRIREYMRRSIGHESVDRLRRLYAHWGILDGAPT